MTKKPFKQAQQKQTPLQTKEDILDSPAAKRVVEVFTATANFYDQLKGNAAGDNEEYGKDQCLLWINKNRYLLEIGAGIEILAPDNQPKPPTFDWHVDTMIMNIKKYLEVGNMKTYPLGIVMVVLQHPQQDAHRVALCYDQLSPAYQALAEKRISGKDISILSNMIAFDFVKRLTTRYQIVGVIVVQALFSSAFPGIFKQPGDTPFYLISTESNTAFAMRYLALDGENNSIYEPEHNMLLSQPPVRFFTAYPKVN